MSELRRIDAHHHLWNYSPAEYGWIDERMSALQRDFTPGDLLEAMHSAHVDGAIAVQARENLDETRWLLQCARTSPHMVGVVGWAPLEAADLNSILEGVPDPLLVGMREVLQGKPLHFLDQQTLDPGICVLTRRSLTYDLLVRAEQLPETTRFVDRHPEQTFILDHAAKPPIAAAEMQPWQDQIHELSRRPNVFCKLSGLVTEADWTHWSLDTLRPYLDTCVDAFTPARLLAGSDWPVCLVASTYARWWQTLEEYLRPFTTHEQARIFGQNALAAYRISA